MHRFPLFVHCCGLNGTCYQHFQKGYAVFSGDHFDGVDVAPDCEGMAGSGVGLVWQT